MGTRNKKAISCIILPLLSILLIAGCSTPTESDSVDIIQALSQGGGSGCYATANKPLELTFPKDFGPHQDFRTEWWYYTGNLITDAGRHFGFQLTFFRQALDCSQPQGQSAWRTRQLYFAHFAVADTQTQSFYSAQRMNRGSVGIAGAHANPFRVWIDNWSSSQIGKAPDSLRLRASENLSAKGGSTSTDILLDLDLIRDKPAIRQGLAGWSRKGPGLSDASYYYSFPGMQANGRISIGVKTFNVSGRVWFDHEWSTSALGKNVKGWDWFALHITQGAMAGVDLMVCHVRQADGKPNGFGFGSISFPNGSYEILGEDDFSIIANAHWTSPESGKRYPARWTVRVPNHNLDFKIKPMIPDQEHPHEFSYYEGAVRVTGETSAGYGYVEMTGYDPL